MATKGWLGGTGNWILNPGDWSPSGVPGSGDDVVISVGGSNVSLTAPTTANSVTIGVSSATLNIENTGGAESITGGFGNSGTLDVDTSNGAGGSSLTIDGTLANTGAVQIGNTAETAVTTLTVGGLTNATSGASFKLDGASSHLATLAFSAGGAGFTSNAGDFELTYAAPLTLGAPFTNSGTFAIHDNTAVTVSGNFTNSATLGVDNFNNGFSADTGGSSLTIDGTLSNTGAVQIGNTAETAVTTLTVGGLTNATSGASFKLDGASSHLATLAFSAGGAGFTSNAGDFELTYAAPLTLGAPFTNSGTFAIHDNTAVTVSGNFTNSATLGVDNFNNGFSADTGGSSLTIDGTLSNTGAVQIGNTAETAVTTLTVGGLTNATSGASFKLDGASSHLATLAFSAGGAGFTSNAGDFELTYAAPLTLGAPFTNSGTFAIHDNTAVTVSGNFTNSATLGVDNFNNGFSADTGGSSLTIDGTLSNTGAVQIGNTAETAVTTLTVGGLTNATSGASFKLDGASSHLATLAFSAGGAGFTSNAGDFELTYAAPLTLGAPFTNSGTFAIHDNTAVTVSGNFTNSATLGVDNFNNGFSADTGGSSLTIDGTLSNTGAVQIGNTAETAVTTLTVGGLTNATSGASFKLDGALSHLATLAFSAGGAGFTSNAGDFELTYAAPLTLGAPFTNSGTFAIHDNTAVTVSGNFTNSATLGVDNFNNGFSADTGGSSLTIDGTLSNTGAVQIGNTAETAVTTLTVGGLTNATSGASFKLDGASSHLATLAFSAGGAGFTSNAGDFELTYAAPLTLGAPFTNSGTFAIHDNTAVTVSGNFTNSATLGVDNFNNGFSADTGGSSLTIDGTLSNTGAVQIGNTAETAVTTLTVGGLTNATSGASFKLDGASSHLATLAFSAGGAGFTSNAGDFELTYAAPLTLGAPFTNSGTFAIHDNTAVTVSGNFTNSATLGVDNFNNGFSADTGGSSLTIDGTLSNTGAVQIGNTAETAVTTLTVGGLTNSGSINLTGASAQQSVLTINGPATSSGTITLSGSSKLAVNAGNTFAETAGTTTVNAGSTLAVTNIDVTGGLLDFTAAITAASGTGNFEIGGNGIVEFGGAVDAGHRVTFSSTAGTMDLGAPPQFTPRIDGLSVGNKIDLLHTAATSVSFANGVLAVQNGTATVSSLNIAGEYATTDFTLASDGNGGTDIGLSQNPSVLSITAPALATVAAGQTTTIGGVSIALSPTIPGETFTVTLSDTNGVLTAAGGTQSNGGKYLTVTGTLDQVNSGLMTLADTDGTPGSDTITINASDSNGGIATPKQIATMVNGTPVIAAPALATVAVNRATAINGVSLSEIGNTANETFTVTVSDANGVLAATGSGVSGSGTTSLTIIGSLSQVNADLATLTDTNGALLPDTIAVSASDSFGNSATEAQTVVVVNGPLVLSAPATASANQDQATPIVSFGLSESGNTSNETFTVTLSDSTGLLSASGSGISGAGTTRLTVTGSLAQVASDLATLTVTDASSVSDKIIINASDSIGNQAVSQSSAVAVQPLTLGGLEGILTTDGSVTVDWSSVKDSYRPFYIDNADWNLIWDRFISQIGTTTQSLIDALKPAAAELSKINPVPTDPSTIDVATLLSYELEHAIGVLPNITLANTTDLAPAGSGLDLSLARSYSANFINRNNPGPFGDGWTFTFDISAINDPSGNVYITSGSGAELFTRQSNGSYICQDGDPLTLTSVGGTYVLTTIDGTVERFLSDGRLSSITDANGNTIDISYNGSGFISSVTSSNGQSLTFATNAQGRIISVADESGRTTTYTYDASGDLLLSVKGPSGEMSYSYAPAGNPTTQNALTQILNPDGTSQVFTYDSLGDLLTQSGTNGASRVTFGYPITGTVNGTDSGGGTWAFVFDANQNLSQITDPLGNLTKLQYNSANDLTEAVTATGAAYAYGYDSTGNITGYTDPNGGTVSATYQPGSNLLSSFTDQNGNTTAYSYNSAGDLTSVNYDNGSGTSYQYSSSGLLTSSTDARGRTTAYTYNTHGLLTRETFSDATSQAYAYNAQGELVSAQATNGDVTTYGYDAAGDLTSVTTPTGQVESYTYGSGGQELTRTEPDGSVTRYSYNSAGQLAAIQDRSGSLITQYSYNALGELSGSLDGNGQTTSYSYDADGNVTQILTKAANGTATSQIAYTYNRDGRPVTATSLDGTWGYTYDPAGQVTAAIFTSTNASIANQNLTYSYDAAGNRTQTIFNGAVSNYTTNNLNQYTASDGTTYSYDADGNLISKTQGATTTTYTYNSQNQLIATNGPSGKVAYQYDALGNMVSSNDNGDVSNYVIDPQAIWTSATGPLSAIAQAYNAAGTVTATYDYGNGLAAEINAGVTNYFNTDATGNITGVSGAGGNLVDSYNYAPFGSLIASTRTVANPFQYAGGWGITTGADGLVDMGARYYDPTQGRFVARDPIGIAGGTNIYAYVNNSPTDVVDPTGLCSKDSKPWWEPILDFLAAIPVVLFDKGIPGLGQLFNVPAIVSKVPTKDFVTAYGGLLDLIAETRDPDNYLTNKVWSQVRAQSQPQGQAQSQPQGQAQSQPQQVLQTAAAGVASELSNGQICPIFPVPVSQLPPVNTGGGNGGNGGVGGDVHVTTFDGMHYDFQAAGEFILAQSTVPGDSFQVQLRMQPWYGGASVSVTTMVAVQVRSDRVTFGLGRASPVWVDGAAVSLPSDGSSLTLAGGTLKQVSSTSWQIDENTGEKVTVFAYDGYLNVNMSSPPGVVQGLLGTNSGNQANEFVLPSGTALPQPLTYRELYTTWADAWRVTQSDSLLDYGAGQTTGTFTDASFPSDAGQTITFAASAIVAAEALVAQAGITDPGLALGAIEDYLSTGDISFIQSAAQLQGMVNTSGIVATPQDPNAMPGVGIYAASVSLTEATTGATSVNFTVFRTGNYSTAQVVHYAVLAPSTADIGAGNFSGGVLPSGQVTIAAGQGSATLTIAVTGNIGSVPQKTLLVQIDSGSSGVPVLAPTSSVTIVNSQAVAGTPAEPALVDITNGRETFQQSGTTYTLNLGSVNLGSTASPVVIDLTNNATAPGDFLSSTFTSTGSNGISVTGLEGPVELAAGGSTPLTVALTGSGALQKTVTFTPVDKNGSGYSATLPTVTLVIAGTAVSMIKGTVANQSTTDQKTVTPFSNVLIADANSVEIETVTVTLSDATNGTLSNLGGGAYNSTTGVYTDSGSVAAVTAALDGLVFTPTPHQVPAGQNVTTGFAINVADTAGASATDSATTVITTDTRPLASATVSINPIDGNGLIDPENAAAGITITGASSDSVAGSLVGQTVAVALAGKRYTGTVASDGTWAVTVPATSLDLLSYGVTYIVGAQVIDQAGHVSTRGVASVTGYELAEATVNSSLLNFGNVRVGSSAEQGISIANSAAGPAANLDAAVGSYSGDLTSVTGQFSDLSRGDTESSDIVATLDTSTAGQKTGTVSLDLKSDNGEGMTSLPGQTVNVTGTVYGEAAFSAAQTTPLILHVGDPGLGSIGVQNTAPVPYSENLVAVVTGATGGISTGSSGTGDIGPQDSATIPFTFDTSAAGTVSGTVDLQYESDGTGIDNRGPTVIGQQAVTVNATIDNYATEAISASAGELTASGTNYTLNLGTILDTDPPLSTTITVTNSAAGPADLLSGNLVLESGSGFTNTGAGKFSNLGAGQSADAQVITLPTSADGTFSETFTINANGSNASGYLGALSGETLTVTGTVMAAQQSPAGATTATLALLAQYMASSFVLAADSSGSGTHLTYVPPVTSDLVNPHP